MGFSAHHVNRDGSSLSPSCCWPSCYTPPRPGGVFQVMRDRTETRHIRHPDGPEMRLPALLAVVTAGFGGFLAQGGTALDEVATRAAGADEREAKVRVSSLTGFEHGTLALIVCPASIVALALGVIIPPPTSPGRGR
jgi:hypothetical protein